MLIDNYDLETLLTNDDLFPWLLNKAEEVRLKERGDKVYLRGLIEFSNYCSCDCYYCGIRKSNINIERYKLTREEILNLAKIAYERGYQSIALQSGEITTDKHVNWLADIIKAIKDLTPSNKQSLGITLSVGELTYAQYKKLYEAGAHRYLLRLETSNKKLFNAIHPPEQSFDKRIECLYILRDLGFQVGSGTMVGLPGQTYEDLVQDLLFFENFGVDMVGLGPYIPHKDTPMGKHPMSSQITDTYTATIKMLALTRIMRPNINIVASTALRTLNEASLETAIRAGANVIMPILTPVSVRNNYSLYHNKRYTPFEELVKRIEAINYKVGLWELGDSPYFFKRIKNDDRRIANE